MARARARFEAVAYAYDRAGAAVASLAFLDGDIVATAKGESYREGGQNMR